MSLMYISSAVKVSVTRRLFLCLFFTIEFTSDMVSDGGRVGVSIVTQPTNYREDIIVILVGMNLYCYNYMQQIVKNVVGKDELVY